MQTFQLVISSLQTFGPAFKAQEDPQMVPPVICTQTDVGGGGENGSAVSAGGSKSAGMEQKTAAQGATPGPATHRSACKNGAMQDVMGEVIRTQAVSKRLSASCYVQSR